MAFDRALDEQVQALVEQLGARVDVAELRAWSRAAGGRIALVGRTAAGKTSLRNRLLGRADPIGLRGVTQRVDAVESAGVTWVDTPGIDGRDTAIDRLGPVFDDVDALVWVVDGLQPLTRTEREVVELLRPPGTPMVCVVSKADLLSDEVDAVVARVEAATGVPVIAADLRSGVVELPAFAPSPRRRAALGVALEAVRRRFAALPVPVDPERLATLLDVRAAVRPWLQRWTAWSERMTVGEMVADFVSGLEAVRADLLVQLAAEPGIATHLGTLAALPEVPALDGLLTTTRIAAAGRESALRELKATAASWMAEVQAELAEWATAIPVDAEGAAWHAAAREALDALS